MYSIPAYCFKCREWTLHFSFEDRYVCEKCHEKYLEELAEIEENLGRGPNERGEDNEII